MVIKNNTRKNNLSGINEVNTSYYYLFNLQKRIYQASQEGHFSLAHSLQKLLLYLPSIKLLAESTLKQKMENIGKDNNSAIKKNSSVRVDKQLIYWCLEAEWIPKIHQTIQRQVYEYQNKFTNLFLDAFLLNTDICLSTLSHRHLSNKLQQVRIVQESIERLLKQDSFSNYTKQKAALIRLNISKVDHLYQLLALILLNGNHWHYFRQSKITMPTLTASIIFFKSLVFNRYMYVDKKVLAVTRMNLIAFSQSIGSVFQNTKENYSTMQYLETINCINNHNYYQIECLSIHRINLIDSIKEELHQNVKDLLFHKDNLGRLRINNNLTVHLMIDKVKLLVSRFSSHHIVTEEKNDFSEAIKVVIETCYYWLKKKYRRPQSYQVKVTLYLLKLRLNNIVKLSDR